MVSGVATQRRVGLDALMTDWKVWGHQLKEAREALGLSQQGLAEKIGAKMSAQTVSNYERGIVKRPSLDTVAKLAAAVRIAAPMTHVVREDVEEAPEITAYFLKHPEHEVFREETVNTLRASNGHLKPHVVRAFVRALADEAEDQRGNEILIHAAGDVSGSRRLTPNLRAKSGSREKSCSSPDLGLDA